MSVKDVKGTKWKMKMKQTVWGSYYFTEDSFETTGKGKGLKTSWDMF